MNLFKDNLSGAIFSEDRRYRYQLWRIWDESKHKIMFIGLNPSTANESTDDPTIRRVIRFAKDWGYGGVLMGNLFALISPYPNDLFTSNDPLGDNDKHLKVMVESAEKVVFAWGAFSQAVNREAEVSSWIDGYCLGKNKDGSPKHPLYLKSDTKLEKF